MVTAQDASVGIGVEGTYRTFATPTRWFEFLSESLNWEKNIVNSAGLRVGSRVSRSSRRAVTSAAGSGDLELEVATKGLGLLLQAALGTATSTVVGATTAYQQNFTLGDNPNSLTIQKGIPRADNSQVDAFTFTGCMVNTLSLEVENDEIAKWTCEFDIGDVTTGQAYVAPSYPTGANVLAFKELAVSMGGTLTAAGATSLASMTGALGAKVRSFSVEINNNLTTDRMNAGNGGRKDKPTVGIREITGSVELEYNEATWRDRFLSDAGFPILVDLIGSTLAGTARPEQVQCVLPVVHLDGSLPESNEGELVTVEMDFSVLDGTTQQPITITQTTTDLAL